MPALELNIDANGTAEKRELGELDITDPGSLIQFADWARKTYPASREILVLDSDGGPGGLMPDDTSAGLTGFMTFNQFQVALSEIGNDRQLELLVLNNPHLAMLEVGFSARQGTQYMIASQSHIWHSDNSYRRMIERLPPPAAKEDTQSVVANLTDALGTARFFDTETGPLLPVATSAVDLNAIHAPLDLANLMALALIADLPLYAPHIQAALDRSQYYDTNGDLKQDQNDNLIDLVLFFAQLQSQLAQAGFDQQTDPMFSSELAAANDATLIHYVTHKVTTDMPAAVGGDVSGSFGVSIFFPPRASHFYDAANYPYAAGAIWNSGPGGQKGAVQTPAWGQLLVDYFALTDPAGAIDTELPRPRDSDTLPEGASQAAIFSNGFE